MSSTTPVEEQKLPEDKATMEHHPTSNIVNFQGLMIAVAVGLFMIFYLGWTYQANWYWFYGIDYIQLNLPWSLFFNEGIIMLGIQLSFVLTIFGIIYIFRLLASLFSKLFAQRGEISPVSPFNIRDLFVKNFHFVVIIYIALIYAFLYEVSIHNDNYSSLQLPAQHAMFSMLVIPLSAILLLRILGDLLSLFSQKTRGQLYASTQQNYEEIYRITADIICIVAASTIFATVMAVGEASIGFKTFEGYQAVQNVFLESEVPIPGLATHRYSCSCNPYIYGPLGYIAKSNDTIYMVPLPLSTVRQFKQFPGLYQIHIPQTNTINIVPFENGS